MLICLAETSAVMFFGHSLFRLVYVDVDVDVNVDVYVDVYVYVQ